MGYAVPNTQKIINQRSRAGSLVLTITVSFGEIHATIWRIMQIMSDFCLWWISKEWNIHSFPFQRANLKNIDCARLYSLLSFWWSSFSTAGTESLLQVQRRPLGPVRVHTRWPTGQGVFWPLWGRSLSLQR